jgi:predicted nucleic acid-binding protein
MIVLIDSDILIEVTRKRDGAILGRWTALSASEHEPWYSAVSEAEIWAGAFPREYAATESLFASLQCASVDAGVGRAAGEILRRYQKSHGVRIADALIAATAIRVGATLWTRNRKHYPSEELTFF